MASDEQDLNKILDKNQKYLDAIHDGIVEGISEGIKRGAIKGAKKAAWDVLKEECLPQGFQNISSSDAEEIVRSLLELTQSIDGEITKAANRIVERNVMRYRNLLIADIIKKSRRKKPGVAFVLELITQRESKVGKLVSERLPRNPISSGVAQSVQTALKISIDRSKQVFINDLKNKLRSTDNTVGESK